MGNDSLTTRMDIQNAGDATKPAARNTKNTTDNGQPPHFTRAINDLPERLHRPSGNTVKIRCPAAGKQLECKRDTFQAPQQQVTQK